MGEPGYPPLVLFLPKPILCIQPSDQFIHSFLLAVLDICFPPFPPLPSWCKSPFPPEFQLILTGLHPHLKDLLYNRQNASQKGNIWPVVLLSCFSDLTLLLGLSSNTSLRLLQTNRPNGSGPASLPTTNDIPTPAGHSGSFTAFQGTPFSFSGSCIWCSLI